MTAFKGKNLSFLTSRQTALLRLVAPTFKQGFILLILASFLLFVACSSSSSDVKQFIQNTKIRKPKPVQPIPEFKRLAPYQYSAQNLRSPFVPFVATTAVTLPPKPLGGPGPDLNRPREILESYPLDTLKMVGTIARADKTYALVQDRQGIIHRVHVGNYMGQSFGKIQRITNAQIELREWVVSPQGKYEERTVIMHLSP